MIIRGRGIVEGESCGEVLYIDQYISFLGDTDPNRGELRLQTKDDRKIYLKDKVLVFKGSRGSSVGSFIIYGLAKNGVGPKAMIVEEIDPVLIAGCVLGNIILIQVDSIKVFEKLNGRKIKLKVDSHSGMGEVFVEGDSNSC